MSGWWRAEKRHAKTQGFESSLAQLDPVVPLMTPIHAAILCGFVDHLLWIDFAPGAASLMMLLRWWVEDGWSLYPLSRVNPMHRWVPCRGDESKKGRWNATRPRRQRIRKGKIEMKALKMNDFTNLTACCLLKTICEKNLWHGQLKT